MKKRVLALLLALVLVLAALPYGAVTVQAAETSGTCGENLTWSLDETTGTLTISGTGEMSSSVPWGPVKSSIRAVKVENGVTSIRSGAFLGCANLTTVSLPETLVWIDDDAFMDCTALTEVEIPKSVETLGNQVFSNCTSLKKVRILGAKTMGFGVFCECTGLEQVTFGKGITQTGYFQFGGCVNLTTVELPDGMTQIANSTFEKCRKLQKITLPESLESIGEIAFSGCVSLGKDFTIPAGVKELQDRAFLNCTGLSDVWFLGDAPKLGSYVFHVETGNDSWPYYEVIPGLTLHYIKGKKGWNPSDWEEFTMVAEGSHTHSYEDRVVAPTCTDQGYTIHTCACGYSYVDSYVNALGHNYQDGVCTRCGAKRSENPFDDVSRRDYYYYAVLWAAKEGITAGVDASHFAPNGTCTRAQVVSFLWRAAGKPEPSSAKNPFTDVSSGDYYYKAVLWAAEKGIVYGTSATKFSPNASCTRAQVVCFLYRYQGNPGHGTKIPFQDVQRGSYYCDAVIWAEENGVVYGTDVNHFSPDKTCTRGQVVCFLYRLLG